ncbi:SH3 domain-containing protein [Clostridium perfringens]|uniref:SH3 domain-containing protein n=1 Tax=Clostridium perfringens TaxID=1502 RepID=UPI001A2B8FBA|nr:SH3 domain-containing protein [Clostridium perfringens]HAT4126708.1 SH3 domain-containing protein [Clostridium perfringens]
MKRKKLSIFILSAAIVTSSISYGISAKADEVKEVKGYNQNINVSTQKGVAKNKVSVEKVHGEILGYANPFTMLEILNTNESTVEVITQNGLRGYVNADEFTLVESAVNDKLIEKNMEGHVTNVSTVLNLRKEPRIGSEIINRLLNNTRVNIIGKQGSWYKIELNGQKGYVYGMFLNEGTIKNNNSNVASNKKSEVKADDKKSTNSSVKSEVKKEIKIEAKQDTISSAKTKVTQKSGQEAKSQTIKKVNPEMNKERNLKGNTEVKSEMKNEVKPEINSEVNTKAIKQVDQEIRQENKPEINLQVRPEINTELKSEETEMVSKENLEVIQEGISEEKSETKSEMKPEVNNKEVSEIIAETKLEQKTESKPEKIEEVNTEKEPEIKPEDKVEEKTETKPESKPETKAEDVLQSEEYRYLRMSISYGERLVDRKDKYTKESLKALRTELEKAKKVFKDSQNLTMKLVEDTRYDLDKAIVDLVKLSDVKKPAESKTKVEIKKDSKTEKNQEIKAEEVKNEPKAKVEEKQEVKSEKVSEEKVEPKKEANTDNVEAIVTEAKEQENKEIKEDEPVKSKEEVKSEVAPEKKSREEEIEEILKSEEYRFLLKDIAYGERLADKFTVYTRDSIKTLNIAIEKAHRVVSEPEKLTKKLVEDTRDDVDRAIVDLVKRDN